MLVTSAVGPVPTGANPQLAVLKSVLLVHQGERGLMRVSGQKQDKRDANRTFIGQIVRKH